MWLKTVQMKEQGLSLADQFKEFPWLYGDLIFPLMMEYLVCVTLPKTWALGTLSNANSLRGTSSGKPSSTSSPSSPFLRTGASTAPGGTAVSRRGTIRQTPLAALRVFGVGTDGMAVSWDQFARLWNQPVHFFLLRHVYHSSISSMKVNKHTATLITFFLSACVHELVMLCLFKKLRGYLLALQMFQLPVSPTPCRFRLAVPPFVLKSKLTRGCSWCAWAGQSGCAGARRSAMCCSGWASLRGRACCAAYTLFSNWQMLGGIGYAWQIFIFICRYFGTQSTLAGVLGAGNAAFLETRGFHR